MINPQAAFYLFLSLFHISETVCDNYGVVKFPTIKIMRHGSIEKLEYRKERNVEALVKYVKEELVDPTILVETEEEALRVQARDFFEMCQYC